MSAIRATKPVAWSSEPGSVAELGHRATDFALALYDSHNESVTLELAGSHGSAELRVTFDDPDFWFQVAAV